ncbi:MAG: hypothetical protein ACRDI2_04640, partial [Chloroflexota bacterium]
GYPSWVEEIAEGADLIVWLDVPFRTAAWRIVKRHVLADLRGNNRHRGYRKLFRFLRGVRDWYGRPDTEYRRSLAGIAGTRDTRWHDAAYCRAHVASCLAPHGQKLLHLTRGSQVDVRRMVTEHLRRL